MRTARTLALVPSVMLKRLVTSHGIFMRRYFNFLGCALLGSGYTVSGNQQTYQRHIQQYDYSDDHLKMAGPDVTVSFAFGAAIVDYFGRIWIFNGSNDSPYGYYYCDLM